jgi:hypothetical protein
VDYTVPIAVHLKRAVVRDVKRTKKLRGAKYENAVPITGIKVVPIVKHLLIPWIVKCLIMFFLSFLLLFLKATELQVYL